MSTKKNTGLINPKREPLTPEKLRELSGLDLSDEQAEEVISPLSRFARIIFDFTVQHKEASKCQNESETRPDE